jgi:hypothetical protein
MSSGYYHTEDQGLRGSFQPAKTRWDLAGNVLDIPYGLRSCGLGHPTAFGRTIQTMKAGPKQERGWWPRGAE